MNPIRSTPTVLLTAALALALAGCENMSERQQGTAKGAGIGAGNSVDVGGAADQAEHLAIRFKGHAVVFPSHSNIEGQVPSRLPVVLREEYEFVLPEIANALSYSHKSDPPYTCSETYRRDTEGGDFDPD